MVSSESLSSWVELNIGMKRSQESAMLYLKNILDKVLKLSPDSQYCWLLTAYRHLRLFTPTYLVEMGKWEDGKDFPKRSRYVLNVGAPAAVVISCAAAH